MAIIDISHSDQHTGVVLENGSVYTFGNISEGKLGHSQELLNPKLDLRNFQS